MTAQVKYWNGGPDPVDFVNCYFVPAHRDHNGNAVPAHWFYASMGLSDTYDDQRQFNRT